MTGWKLFKIRFIEDIKYQREVLGTVMDWVIGLYIFIPITIFGIIFYVDFWRDITSYWLEPLDSRLILVFLFFPFINSSFRSFMHEADQLFLLNQSILYKRFRMTTYVYSILQMMGTTVILILLALPWLVQLVGLGRSDVLFLFILLMAFRVVVASVMRVVSYPVERWLFIGIFYLTVAFMVYYLSLEVLSLVGAFILLLLLPWHLVKIVPTKRYFFHEVSEESKERVRYIKFIIGAATNVEKPPTRLGKRPFIFRRSRRICKGNSPENGLLELLIKGLLRHSVYLRSYLQLIGLTLFAILVLPIWVKWIVFISFVLFLNYNSWLKGLYEKMLDEYFFTVVPIKVHVREAVWPRFKRILLIPAVSFIGFVTFVLTIIPIF